MKHGRSRHLVRTIILLVAVVVAFIVVSAAIRYNRKSGLFDPRKKDTEQNTPVSHMEKRSRLNPDRGILNRDSESLFVSVSI